MRAVQCAVRKAGRRRRCFLVAGTDGAAMSSAKCTQARMQLTHTQATGPQTVSSNQSSLTAHSPQLLGETAHGSRGQQRRTGRCQPADDGAEGFNPEMGKTPSVRASGHPLALVPSCLSSPPNQYMCARRNESLTPVRARNGTLLCTSVLYNYPAPRRPKDQLLPRHNSLPYRCTGPPASV